MSADTSAEIERRYTKMIMSRSPQERVEMCFAMSDTAREIVRRSLERAGVPSEEIAPALLRRLYGADLPPQQLLECGKRVRAGAGNGRSGGWVSEVDRLLRRAIAERRLVAFSLAGCARVAEPHDYGLIGGVAKLFFYQVGGASRSGQPLGWRWAELAKLSELRVLDQHFPGSRALPTGRHHRWDVLYASVSVR
jgi:hypothetical protein